jgi:hypothetical protein
VDKQERTNIRCHCGPIDRDGLFRSTVEFWTCGPLAIWRSRPSEKKERSVYLEQLKDTEGHTWAKNKKSRRTEGTPISQRGPSQSLKQIRVPKEMGRRGRRGRERTRGCMTQATFPKWLLKDPPCWMGEGALPLPSCSPRAIYV